ncbi:hypothetical protein A8V01_07200 [Novosphingobium guangzhouense]|uniref:Lipoprotein n=2 Tax=Novosphingobium guangzhouense TaxID=1850347 RepID=A0A2K2FVN4_9SPHN|nr:hypothetical protein A8V01_07200 [Novosphingobium guangzhouense]
MPQSGFFHHTNKEFSAMMKRVIVGSVLALSMLSGCQSYTSRHDVREAHRDVRDAYRYGDRRDQRDARRNARETRRDYERDNRCGPRYGRPC